MVRVVPASRRSEVPRMLRRPSTGLVARAAACLACSLLLLPLVAAAQGADDQGVPAGPTIDVPRRDYMLGRAHGSVAVRGTWLFASTGSDIYDFVTEQLTLEKKAFNAPSLDIEADVALTPRLDVGGGFQFSSTSKGSEYRHFEDNAGLPIEQTTSLKQFGIGASAKYALVPRGRRVSRFAWVPRSVVPYVGAGAGLQKYELVQQGDYVDAETLRVFSDTFRSEGWAPSAHAFGGVDVQAYRQLYVTAEARYVWSSADLEADFVGFDPIDLSGFRCGAGIRLVF